MTEEKNEEEEEETTCSIEEIQEMQEYKDKYLRLLAESENARKRMQKERRDLTNYAIEGVINEFLHPLDHFEKALRFAEAQSAEVKNWAIGFEMILAQFKDILASHGVIGYISVGEKFDPHLHEAVEMVETNEHPHGTIVEEFVRGYKIGDKTLRVARVKVAKEIEKFNQGESDE
ncbi:MAG: nucleotide exchange factor GrpE [Chlamydiia bacterium]|nr:nucleotide exchange factor GrpE [Chlamydiia bacterium]